LGKNSFINEYESSRNMFAQLGAFVDLIFRSIEITAWLYLAAAYLAGLLPFPMAMEMQVVFLST
jgi:hypothetical protein